MSICGRVRGLSAATLRRRSGRLPRNPTRLGQHIAPHRTRSVLVIPDFATLSFFNEIKSHPKLYNLGAIHSTSQSLSRGSNDTVSSAQAFWSAPSVAYFVRRKSRKRSVMRLPVPGIVWQPQGMPSPLPPNPQCTITRRRRARLRPDPARRSERWHRHKRCDGEKQRREQGH